MLKYHDHRQIELGDSIRYNNSYGEIERVVYPGTKNCVDLNVMNGGVLIRLQGGTLYAFEYNNCELSCPASFVFLHRATLSFHIRYSFRKFIVFIKNLKYLARKCVHGNFNDGLFFLKEWVASIVELLYAVRYGAGSGVIQLGYGERVIMISRR